MSNAYNFTITKSRALLLTGCFAAATVLTFFAGAISGVLYSSSRVEAALAAAKATESAAATPASKPVKPAPISAPEAAISNATVAAGSANASPAPSGNASPQISGTVPAAAVVSPKPQEPAAPPAATATAVEPKPSPASPAATIASAQPPATAASAATPRAEESTYEIPMAVAVGSFRVKANAEKLMESLKDLGYNPVMSHSTDARGTWYLIKLGPYKGWDAASKVAMRVSIAENLHPVIGPMR